MSDKQFIVEELLRHRRVIAARLIVITKELNAITVEIGNLKHREVELSMERAQLFSEATDIKEGINNKYGKDG